MSEEFDVWVVAEAADRAAYLHDSKIEELKAEHERRIEELKKEHDRRVTELLEANNRYLEGGRAARRVIKQIGAILEVALEDISEDGLDEGNGRQAVKQALMAARGWIDGPQMLVLGRREVALGASTLFGVPAIVLAPAPPRRPVAVEDIQELPGAVVIALASYDGATALLEVIAEAVRCFDPFIPKKE